jgi:flagellar hook protein FlgE
MSSHGMIMAKYQNGSRKRKYKVTLKGVKMENELVVMKLGANEYINTK